MKKFLSLILAFMLVFSMVSVTSFGGGAPEYVNITGALDVTAWGNAMRIYFDQNLTTSEDDIVTLLNIQALKPGDADYDEDVVNGVLDGITVNDKTVREWNTHAGGDYAVMVHYHKEYGDYFIAVWADAGLVDFLDGEEHFVSVGSIFTTYNMLNALGGAFVLNPATMVWENAKLNITQGLDLTAWGNAMRVYFEENITKSEEDLLIQNVQALNPGDDHYDTTVKKGVLDGIIIDGHSVREWNALAGGEYGVMVHYFRETGQNFIDIYAAAELIDFSEGAHTVTFNSNFKSYCMREAPGATVYQDADTQEWSLTAPLPVMSVAGGDSHPDFAWGNTMRVLFDTPIWEPGNAEELLLNAHSLTPGDDYYNEEAVESILNKVIVNGKSIAQWNDIDPGIAQVHVGSNENDLRIYISEDQFVFNDGDTHVVTIERNFISFSGYTTSEKVSLHYDPVAKTWGTEVVVPPTPTPAPATFVYLPGPMMMTGDFGNVAFYTTTRITVAERLNIQAGGGSIPDDVRDAVRNYIKVNGKTVGEWNIEYESDYAFMVAFDSEDAGGGTFLGRISIWSENDEFTPDHDQTVEFLEGLVGLNGAPIEPSKWQYVAAEGEWHQVFEDDETDPSEESPSPAPVDETDTPGDNGLHFIIAILMIAFVTLFAVAKSHKSAKENNQ